MGEFAAPPDPLGDVVAEDHAVDALEIGVALHPQCAPGRDPGQPDGLVDAVLGARVGGHDVEGFLLARITR